MTAVENERRGPVKGHGLRSVGAGPDGASHLGFDDQERPVLVHRLRADVVADLRRRRRLERRIDFQQRHTGGGVEGLVHVDLAGPKPVVATRNGLRTVDGLPPGRPFVDALIGLCRGLAAAHAEGIVHTALSPTTVFVAEDGSWFVSFLDLDTGTVVAPRPSWPRPRDAALRAAGDAFALGALIVDRIAGEHGVGAVIGGAPITGLTTTSTLERELLEVATELMAAEPAERPLLHDVVAVLERVAARREASPTIAADRSSTLPTVPEGGGAAPGPTVHRVGRFTLGDKLGAGAMGQVYRAVDGDTGDVVAVKLISRDVAPSERALRRFRKEARLLAELQHPGIARYLDAGEADDGTLYLVTELVTGRPLSSLIRERGPLPEAEALALVTDLVAALVDVHDNGIVHRDIKPDNIMVVDRAPGSPSRVKLIDFGVARHVDEQGSLAMTRQGAVLGTPLYMAPEQARGDAVDARSDLYAVGTTLFELLMGQAPFAGHGVTQVLAMQIEAPAPRIRDLRPDVSFEVAEIVARCLEKDAAGRFKDARALFADLERLRPSPRSGLQSLPPATPPANPTSTSTKYVSTFDLRSTPAQLWPFVANTDRLNKAIGLAAAVEEIVVVDDDVRRHGRSKQVGFSIAWQEHPFEWLFEQRLGVLREYSEGPLRWMRSTVELAPTPTGTKLVQTIELEPRGLIGRVGAGVEVGMRMRAALERVYGRIDALLQGRLGNGGAVDPFELAPRLPHEVEIRFAVLERQAVASGAAAGVIDALGTWLREAPAQEVARIRPIALARRLSTSEDAVIEACLHAAAVGLLTPLWDILCPSCRVPSSMESSLRALREHGRCDVCNLAFSLDLASSIELVFQVHRSLRVADASTYCISSPAHTPHVMAQLRLGPGESRALDLGLPEGQYRITCRPLATSTSLRVRRDAPRHQLDVSLSTLSAPDNIEGAAWQLPLPRQAIRIANDSERSQLVRVERSTPRDDVLTASRMLSSSLFRRLLPEQVMHEGTMMRVSAVTLLAVMPRVKKPTLEELYSFYRQVDEIVAGHGGTVVRLHGDGVLTSFHEPIAAVRAATTLAARLPIPVAAAVHRAPAGAVSLNERLDYFGRGVQELLGIVERAAPGELLLSAAVAAEVKGLIDLEGVVASNVPDAMALDDETVQYRLPASGSAP